MNFHSMRCLIIVRWTLSKDGLENKFFIEKLSDCIILGYPRREPNRLNACMNRSADKSDNNSKCMERVTIQVNRQMYTFVHPSSLSMCNGPIKSNPVFSNGNVSDVRIFGRSAIFCSNGLVSCFLQITQFLSTPFTAALPFRIQKFCRSVVRV
ncbi:hypothetical protein T4A_4160 [Trichinella pseudospiralis]|uniref:Uncharacterized protein n=1 Tax=Trichinella pseudospiralis TaxID=6337 RepID=A0A0V1EW16_TRIPS|nr:hypothetical protein T4A_4160 [Trichinella pseudospiralis]